MKSHLIFLLFLVLIVPQIFADNLQPPPQLQENAMDHPVLIGERPSDHPVVIGERASDTSAAGGHLAPLIFMVMAFVITVIVGVIIWRSKTWVVPTILAAIFALVTLLLLANVNYYVSDQHPGLDLSSNNHHWFEMILSLLAFVLMLSLFLLFSTPILKYVVIVLSGIAELIVIVILLNIFPHHQYFKICNNQCVMRGSQAGVTFDLPCADNVAFMALHHTTGINVADFMTAYSAGGTLPRFLEQGAAVALHDPLYPSVHAVGPSLRSEDIRFSLEETMRNPVAICSLFVRVDSYSKSEIEAPGFALPALAEDAASLTGAWSRSGGVLTRTFPSTGAVAAVEHTGSFGAQSNKVTFVKYRFKVTYSNPAGEEPIPDESSEVTFVLQDYYNIYPDHPAPVYAQGDMRDVMDLLFIPAQSDGVADPLEPSFFQDFRTSCRTIVKDVLFQEPSLRYWRKHFNVWINPAAGRASDGRCGDCCHVAPSNVDFIPEEIEFKALLHKNSQLDFTDHCNEFFSAEMDLVSDLNEKSSFLHELGHAAFGLCDEYPDGFNYQAVDHLPNNWHSRRAATTDAPLRHKHSSDVVRLH